MEENKSDSQLNLAYWLVGQKIIFKKILLGLFIAFDIFFIGWSFYGLVKIFLEKPFVWQQVAINFPPPPQNLEVNEIIVLSLGKNHYDLIAKIHNPNDKITATYFDYQFTDSNFTGKLMPGFILPNEEKEIVELGIESETPLTAPNLEFFNIKWLRIGKVMPTQEYEDFKQSHLNLEIKDKVFVPASESDISQKIPVSKSAFTIANNTAYSYYNLGLLVTLYSNGNLVGANYYSLNNFLSGETRKVDLNWTQVLSRNIEIRVEPEVNIFNENAYIRPL